tara:strand:- start:711 stop:992 length:282 start_codon:yes stop_codon:yes gene_type:complete
MKKQVNNELIDMTAEEITQLQNDQVTPMTDLEASLSELRKLRNNLLFETDWLANSDVTMSDEWKTYRQELRDLPSGLDTVEKVNNITWPTKPS